MPSFVQRLFAGLIIASTATLASSAISTGGCFYADSGPKLPESGCGGDVLGLSRQPAIARVLAIYSLAGVRVDFIGCKVTDFSTGRFGPTSKTRYYEIHYRLLEAEDPQIYLAPITHELSHVVQLEMAGGDSRLRAMYEIRRIELAADFLTGMVFKRLGENAAQLNGFQQNLQLVGKYRESKEEEHGTPEEREKAFRFGYFSPLSAPDWASIHQTFQDNVYGSVVGY